MKSYEKMVEYSKQRSMQRQREVIQVMLVMKQKGIPINFSSVATWARSSKSYLYNNQVLSDKIRRERARYHADLYASLGIKLNDVDNNKADRTD